MNLKLNKYRVGTQRVFYEKIKTFAHLGSNKKVACLVNMVKRLGTHPRVLCDASMTQSCPRLSKLKEEKYSREHLKIAESFRHNR